MNIYFYLYKGYTQPWYDITWTAAVAFRVNLIIVHTILTVAIYCPCHASAGIANLHILITLGHTRSHWENNRNEQWDRLKKVWNTDLNQKSVSNRLSGTHLSQKYDSFSAWQKDLMQHKNQGCDQEYSQVLKHSSLEAQLNIFSKILPNTLSKTKDLQCFFASYIQQILFWDIFYYIVLTIWFFIG